MLTKTCTELIKFKNFKLYVYGNKENKTDIISFVDNGFDMSKSQATKYYGKIIGVCNNIDTNPLRYQHQEKFKKLEGDIWEIKTKQLRCACVWHAEHKALVIIHAIVKKRNSWLQCEVKKAMRELAKFKSQQK